MGSEVTCESNSLTQGGYSRTKISKTLLENIRLYICVCLQFLYTGECAAIRYGMYNFLNIYLKPS